MVDKGYEKINIRDKNAAGLCVSHSEPKILEKRSGRVGFDF